MEFIPKNKEEEKAMLECIGVDSIKLLFSDIISPLSVEVLEVNERLMDAPETVNKDCYGEGWIAKVKIKDKSELDSLMSAEEYKKLIE
jgi:glycine cleavage system H protein